MSDGFVAIVLAAGSSKRMKGVDKLLQKIDGQTLLRRSVETVLASDIDRVIVVTGPNDRARRDELSGLDVDVIIAENAADGMSASLCAGIRSAGMKPRGYLICLADMPALTPSHINSVIDGHDAEEGRLIIRPKSPSAQYGHPVLFDRKYYEAFTALTGDVGAGSIIKNTREDVYEIEMDEAVCIDLDTPEAWKTWRANSGSAIDLS